MSPVQTALRNLGALFRVSGATSAGYPVMTICFIIVILVLFLYLDKLKKENHMILYENRLLSEQFKVMEEKAEARSRRMHDYKYQLHLLELSMKNPETADGKNRAAFAGLRETMRNDTVFTWCSSPLVNAIMNEKTAEAKEKGIQVVTDIDFFPCTMDERDFCVAFSNLFDNCIEACKDQKDPRITLTVKTRGDACIVKLVNTIVQKPRMEGDRFLTRKTDSSQHGFGINNARQYMEKNGRTLDIMFDDRYFYATMVL